MLKIKANPTFKAKVKITVPGESTPAVLDVTYRHKGAKALADWWKSVATRPVTEALGDIIAGIDDLHDENGNPVAYSTEALIQMLDEYHTAGSELLEAYFLGMTESRTKNSSKPSVI